MAGRPNSQYLLSGIAENFDRIGSQIEALCYAEFSANTRHLLQSPTREGSWSDLCFQQSMASDFNAVALGVTGLHYLSDTARLHTQAVEFGRLCDVRGRLAIAKTKFRVAQAIVYRYLIAGQFSTLILSENFFARKRRELSAAFIQGYLEQFEREKTAFPDETSRHLNNIEQVVLAYGLVKYHFDANISHPAFDCLAEKLRQLLLAQSAIRQSEALHTSHKKTSMDAKAAELEFYLEKLIQIESKKLNDTLDSSARLTALLLSSRGKEALNPNSSGHILLLNGAWKNLKKQCFRMLYNQQKVWLAGRLDRYAALTSPQLLLVYRKLKDNLIAPLKSLIDQEKSSDSLEKYQAVLTELTSHLISIVYNMLARARLFYEKGHDDLVYGTQLEMAEMNRRASRLLGTHFSFSAPEHLAFQLIESFQHHTFTVMIQNDASNLSLETQWPVCCDELIVFLGADDKDAKHVIESKEAVLTLKKSYQARLAAAQSEKNFREDLFGFELLLFPSLDVLNRLNQDDLRFCAWQKLFLKPLRQSAMRQFEIQFQCIMHLKHLLGNVKTTVEFVDFMQAQETNLEMALAFEKNIKSELGFIKKEQSWLRFLWDLIQRKHQTFKLKEQGLLAWQEKLEVFYTEWLSMLSRFDAIIMENPSAIVFAEMGKANLTFSQYQLLTALQTCFVRTLTREMNEDPSTFRRRLQAKTASLHAACDPNQYLLNTLKGLSEGEGDGEWAIAYGTLQTTMLNLEMQCKQRGESSDLIKAFLAFCLFNFSNVSDAKNTMTKQLVQSGYATQTEANQIVEKLTHYLMVHMSSALVDPISLSVSETRSVFFECFSGQGLLFSDELRTAFILAFNEQADHFQSLTSMKNQLVNHVSQILQANKKMSVELLEQARTFSNFLLDFAFFKEVKILIDERMLASKRKAEPPLLKTPPSLSKNYNASKGFFNHGNQSASRPSESEYERYKRLHLLTMIGMTRQN